jgi:hypothetical protein
MATGATTTTASAPASPAAPRALARARMRSRHLGWLASDLAWTARVNRTWWLLPVVVVALLALAAGGATQAALPYAVYTLF